MFTGWLTIEKENKIYQMKRRLTIELLINLIIN